MAAITKGVVQHAEYSCLTRCGHKMFRYLPLAEFNTGM
jgi:hypothetical protein